jgi:probable F420-dependent oxidoreductase
MSAMRFGLFAVNFGACADPALQRRVARAAEESGFESIWTGEHVAMPVHDSPVMIDAATPFLDSLVTLGHLAAHTERVRLGTGILVLPHHNPMLLAKALATLDVLSGGRLIAGFGGGYVEAEFKALGIPFHKRGAITDEYLDAMRAIWTEELPRFSGRFASFGDVRCEPKPLQRPHPPIVIGGVSTPALRRAARVGDGWYGFGQTVEQTVEIVRELGRLRAELGRADRPFEISLTTFEPLSPELVAQAVDAGVHRLILFPRARPDALEATVRRLGADFVQA